MNDALIVGLACIALRRPADNTCHRLLRQACAEVLAVGGRVHDQSGPTDILEKSQ